jgi:signal transduction histidine kinase/ActR/RegA family two-component response regulator
MFGGLGGEGFVRTTMFERARQWLGNMELATPAERRNAPIVQLVCVVGAAVLLVGEALRVLDGRLRRLDPLGCMHLAGAAFLVAAFILLKRGRYQAGVHHLLVGTVGVTALGVAYSGPTYVALWIHVLAVPLALSALLVGRRALWATAAIYAVAILVGSARDHGYLLGKGPRPSALGPFGTTLDIVISFAFLAFVLDGLGAGLWEGLLRSEKDARETQRANAALELEIARRRSTEVQLYEAQKMEAIAQLSGGLAHDFNNLLTIILSCTSSSKKGLAPDHPLYASLEEITEAAREGAELTRQLFTVAKRQVVEPRLVAISAKIQDMERMLRHAAGEGIELELELDRPGWEVLVDPGQLEQVLLNLVINARDAMDGHGILRIRTAGVAGAGAVGDAVELCVEDDGCGMSPELAARVFEPFFTTKEPGKGTGLGLATCYGIVKQAGGVITFTSEQGRGTAFRLVLPRSGRARSDVGPVPASGTAVGSETLLLVEDEETLRRILANALRRHGYTVLEAKSTEQALSASREYRGIIHLLVTDIVTAGQSGRELAEHMIADRPALKVLFLSGSSGAVVLDQAISPDAIEHLGKPFVPDTLEAKIRTVLDRPPTSTVRRLAASAAHAGSSHPSSPIRGLRDLPRT